LLAHLAKGHRLYELFSSLGVRHCYTFSHFNLPCITPQLNGKYLAGMALEEVIMTFTFAVDLTMIGIKNKRK
jgi:hypothetical protein